MRTTDLAMDSFNKALGSVMGKETNLKDLGSCLSDMAFGFYQMTLAIQEVYDKLRRIDRKLSSAPSTCKTPRM